MELHWIWIGFNLLILTMLTIDLGLFHRRPHALALKEAAAWSSAWISLALLFNLGLYFLWDSLFPDSSYSRGEAALVFLTGYLIELSLSVDNLFVMALIFLRCGVPAAYQHRVLFWGILGALIMRGAMIAAGTTLLKEFHWLIYVFGAFLLFTGVKMIIQREIEFNPEDSRLIRFFRRFLPVTGSYEKENFFVRSPTGMLLATPLFLVLMLIEVTDLVFAVDSIPAIFGITQDPFLIYASNVFAILGLRSLYFVLAGMMGLFVYLKPALSAILIFVGGKMILADIYKISSLVSLGIVAAILSFALVMSWIVERRRRRKAEAVEKFFDL
jgi:tellurite resistance protein TerC